VCGVCRDCQTSGVRPMMESVMMIYANEGFEDDGSPFAWLNLTADMYHATFMIRPEEFELFSRVPKATKNDRERKSIQIGVCGESAAFWFSDADGVHVLIGADPEQSWHVGLTLPAGALEEISEALEALGE